MKSWETCSRSCSSPLLRSCFRLHSLVSSGTSSKTVANEKDMLKVGYGAMVLESLLAVLALCVAGAAAGADGTPAAGTPFQIFSSGVAGFFQMFGVPMYIASAS